jgi:hypothetical protein|tara:strand:+ start:391 stop:648 length:258 start_codon:yes stop_codon:yes gene_type:complete
MNANQEPHEAFMKRMSKEMDAKSRQVDGSHYQLPIQPIDFIVKNEIPFREANIIKYIVRHRSKNGKKDIEKAMHYLQMIYEEYDA